MVLIKCKHDHFKTHGVCVGCPAPVEECHCPTRKDCVFCKARLCSISGNEMNCCKFQGHYYLDEGFCCVSCADDGKLRTQYRPL